MHIDQLRQKLADVDAATLQSFILDLYLHYPELSDKIEALSLHSDLVALGKRLQSLRLCLYRFLRELTWLIQATKG